MSGRTTFLGKVAAQAGRGLVAFTSSLKAGFRK